MSNENETIEERRQRVLASFSWEDYVRKSQEGGNNDFYDKVEQNGFRELPSWGKPSIFT